MLAAAHLLLESVGELYGGVAAYGDFYGDGVGRAVYGNIAVERRGVSLHVCQVAGQSGGDKQVAHAVGARHVAYAGNLLEQPFVNLSHHEVVPR